MGLNDGYFKRLGDFCYDLVFHGDLGDSYVNRLPVLDLIKSRLPATVTMAVASVGFALVLGLVLGVISAARPYTLLDNVSMTLALVGVSMPNSVSYTHLDVYKRQAFTSVRFKKGGWTQLQI